MIRLYASLGLVVAIEIAALGTASADNDAVMPVDSSVGSFDPDQAVAPITSVEGPGISIGDNFVIHPVVGVEGGYVSNVFYTSSNPVGAGLIRGLLELSAGSPTGERIQPADSSSDAAVEPSLLYRVSLRGAWDEYLSGNATVRGTSGLSAGGTVHLVAAPSGPWTFGVDEDFQRYIRATNFESSENTNRDINSIGLNLLWHPADRAITGYLYYTNVADMFEESLGIYPNRMLNTFGVHPQWKIFPETQVFIDVSMSFDTGIDNTNIVKNDSTPLIAIAGVQTLLSLNTTLVAHAGYTNGFYSAGPSYSAPELGFDVGYRYSPLGRITLGYNWLYQDSINANYYRDHDIHALLTQQLNPVTFVIQPELIFRQYNGIDTVVPGAEPTRNDTIFSLVAGIHYSFRNWIAASLDYRLTDVSTDYRYPQASGEPFDPSYVRHEILLGLRLAR